VSQSPASEVRWLDGLCDPAALPRPNAVSAPYFRAAARGELIFQRCAAGHPFLYPRSLCPVCHSVELEWERAAGTGEVVTFAPVHRPPWNDLPRPLPYVIALVRLDEGPQLLGTLEDIEASQASVGLRVAAAFERAAAEIGLVRWVPAEAVDAF
jgi:uncharacterized protein